MKRYINSLLALFLFSILFVYCSEDESNPVAPAYVGTYSGYNNMDKPVLIKISDVGGRGFVTKYSLEYEYEDGNFIRSGTKALEITSGIEEVISNKFNIVLSGDEDEFLKGTVKSSSIEGSFSVFTGKTTGSGEKIYVAGTYVIEKE